MENGNNTPWYYSWVAIGIGLCGPWWPIGIALLILRLNHTKATAAFGKNQKIIFYVVAGFLFFMALMSFSLGGFSNFLWGILFAVGGGAVIYYTQKTVKQSERFRQYINLIVNQGIDSIDTIAAMSDIDSDVVVADLNKMVSQGILKNAVVDQMLRTVTLQPVVQQPQIVYANNANVTNSEPPQIVTATCPGCGAKMAVAKGTVRICEYCDTPINA